MLRLALSVLCCNMLAIRGAYHVAGGIYGGAKPAVAMVFGGGQESCLSI